MQSHLIEAESVVAIVAEETEIAVVEAIEVVETPVEEKINTVRTIVSKEERIGTTAIAVIEITEQAAAEKEVMMITWTASM